MDWASSQYNTTKTTNFILSLSNSFQVDKFHLSLDRKVIKIKTIARNKGYKDNLIDMYSITKKNSSTRDCFHSKIIFAKSI